MGPLAELPPGGRRGGRDPLGGYWYDLTKFFDQVLHLDGERLLRFRQAVGLPGLNRLLRLAGTTCGDDAKLADGLTEDLIPA